MFKILLLLLSVQTAFGWGDFYYDELASSSSEQILQMQNAMDLDEEAEFQELKTNYYPHLNYFDPEVVKKIPQYEVQLNRRALQILNKAPEHRTAFEGVHLAYAAMFMANNRIGIYDKLLSIDVIAPEYRFTNKTDESSILLARQNKIVEWLKVAHHLNPENPRIELWLSGSELILHVLKGNKPTQTQIDKLLHEATKGMFGFFNSLITLNCIKYTTPEIEKNLRDRAVEILKLLPRNKVDSKETMKRARAVSFSIIGALNYLGNYIAMASEKNTTEKERKFYINKARTAWAYAQLPFVTGTKRYKWPMLKDAQKIRNAHGPLKTNTTNYDWKSIEVKRVQSCTACHADIK